MSAQSIRCAAHHESTSYTALCVCAGHPLYRPVAPQWPVHALALEEAQSVNTPLLAAGLLH